MQYSPVAVLVLATLSFANDPTMQVVRRRASPAVPSVGDAMHARDLGDRLHKLTRPPRDAGTFHRSTGTWTRNASTANAGDKVIVYNNTCNARYFATVTPGATWFDEGRLPSTTSPDSLWVPIGPGTSILGSARGCLDAYAIQGMQVTACFDHGFGGPGESMSLTFLESYSYCHPITATPVASFLVTGIPGGTPLGGVNCWTFAIDLEPVPPSTVDSTFTMKADGDGSFNGVDEDRFGWGFSFPTSTGTNFGGTLVAGDYESGLGCSGYDGTVFDLSCHPVGSLAPHFPQNGAFAQPFSGFSEDGTGMGTFDAFRIDPGQVFLPPAGFTSCFNFTGNPMASFRLELYSAVRCAPCEPGTTYCAGDSIDSAVTALCPCGNFGAAGRGCANSNSALGGGHLTASGTTSPNTILFTCDGIPNGNLSTFLRGTASTNTGFVFGDGVRCQAGTTVRFGQQTSGPAGGNPNFTVLAPTATVLAGNTRFYQTHYRNPAAGFCPPAVFNISNGYRLVW